MIRKKSFLFSKDIDLRLDLTDIKNQFWENIIPHNSILIRAVFR